MAYLPSTPGQLVIPRNEKELGKRTRQALSVSVSVSAGTIR